jgi:hypothetical protein
MYKYYIINMNQRDKFWLLDINILLQHDRLIEYVPIFEMTIIEKLNAIMRMAIYSGIALFLLTYKNIYLYIPLIVGLFTILIYEFNKNNPKLNMNSASENFNIKKVKKTKPTKDNPFMNINLITDKKNKVESYTSYNDNNIKNQITKKFNHNLYRDVSDLYSKNNSQREFYTMPSTQIPNQQNKFADWLYKTGPTCKENTIKCLPGITSTPLLSTI